MQNTDKYPLPMAAEKLIRHRPPMLLISELTKREGDNATANANLTKESMFHSDKRGILPEYYIEIIAQTMAAANGYDNMVEGKGPMDGFIVGLDNFQFKSSNIIKEFTIEIEKTMEFGAMKVLNGEVFANGVSVATAELKVWEQEKNA